MRMEGRPSEDEADGVEAARELVELGDAVRGAINDHWRQTLPDQRPENGSETCGYMD